ncbi:MAG: right-handed parallel beta-helix repeat-containing protein [Paenibacillaceae bacterium]
MKRREILWLRLWLVVWLPLFIVFGLQEGSTVEAAETSAGSSLQQLIDQTPDGSTLLLSSAVYEGAVTIDKPIRIKAEGKVQIRNSGDQPVIHIRSDNVHLEGLQVIQNSEEQSAAVLVTASETVLEALDIGTRSFGIILRDGGENEIRNTRISWMESSSQTTEKGTEKHNGIDLFNSHDNLITSNEISSMNDGIYMESSHRNVVANNKIDHSRYGIHCMYTDGTVLRGNIGSFNITGAMVMGVKDVEVSDNTFFKQSESVNSQGLLLFDVQTSKIHHNKVVGNRVGLYIEQSQRNEIRDNEVTQNFVGIQLLESEGNRFSENRFIGNVIEAEAADSKDNVLTGNFWDAFRGIDADGDGVSDLSYTINPFFQRLTSATPAYQLFFQSPGMLFLESMYTADKAEWSVDHAPLMKAGNFNEAERSGSIQMNILLTGLLLLALSIFTIYFVGVKRK